ncbi:Glutamine--fructose-6-phosphate aminotransferase [isomerizing] [Candidatus Bilamarchaeum dharawalense]|uniref:Amidophosphoribosyltransferase n=1 Tax=Candidatus Bilamarchaeum dharawalense TaxID=2885759 RepID=A0A5E4LWM8_9ARCH|nr:Glutamine--fructose-6-phosphate aminotransferase [isomerizing] [Candidatus Bilamarchaeum dharawalense]
MVTTTYFDQKRFSSWETEEKREECGIVGIYSKKGTDVAPYLYRALIALQHRGQDAAGFAVFDGKKIEPHRGVGMVDQIFNHKDIDAKGYIGIGHTRYPTIGECRLCDVQPTVFQGVATAHNGHVANYDELKKQLEHVGYTFDSTVDSEPIAYMLHENKEIDRGVTEVMKRAQGSFSDAAIFQNKLIIFRDPHAIRPLVWGENEELICFASETVALDINNIPYKGVVKGGERIIVQENGTLDRKQIVPEQPRHCMFEYVYFARPDSILNERGVYQARRKLGEFLAKEAPVDADVVVAVPDTSRPAAASYAATLGLPCEEGLIKNRYIGRTFIMPNQEKRVGAVKLKLNPLKDIIEGKRIVLVDDSIVRGTTLKEIVALVRGAGAIEVHLRITCPPVKAPCFYGVDMSTYGELIANKKTVDEIRKYLNADSLHYISIEGLKKAINLPLCTGCLNEDYPTKYVKELAAKTKNEEM